MFPVIFLFPLAIFLSLHVSVLVVHMANAPILGWTQLSPILLFLVVLSTVYATLRIARYQGSPALPATILVLCGIGLAVQFRIGTVQPLSMASPSQLALPLGIIVMLGAYLVGRHGRTSRLEPLWPAFLILSILIVLFVLIAGRKYRGAVYLPGNINPVEIIKPLLVVFIASMIAGHRKTLARGFLGIPLPPIDIIVTLGILWAPPMLMLLLQGDMGLFALMNMTLLVMLYATTGRTAYLTGGFAAILILGRLLMPLTTRGAARLAAWLNPFTAPTGGGWQPLQALVALYAGGILGTGFGAGSPRIVPIVESDFAYIIIGEELGLIGCLLVGAIYVALIVAGMRIAERTADPYRSTVATGMTACLGLQILLNIGGVTKAIPLTGIPLPLISHGGSSLVTTLLMAGLLMAIADDRPPTKKRTTAKKTATKPSPTRQKKRTSPRKRQRAAQWSISLSILHFHSNFHRKLAIINFFCYFLT